MDAETIRRLHHLSDPPKMRNPWLFILAVIVMLGIMVIILSSLAYPQPATEGINIERLVAAIYYAEGGAKTKHPYGIKSIDTKGDKEYARKICINSINNAIKRWNKAGQPEDFITFMGRRYSPPAINPNWVRLVKYFLNKG